MKKPLNNFAFALGLLAVAYALLVIPQIVELIRQPLALKAQLAQRDATYVQSFAERDIVSYLRNTIYGSGVLMGLAVLVEFADRIRWNMLTPEERAKPANLTRST
jgi:hypothetical protein